LAASLTLAACPCARAAVTVMSSSSARSAVSLPVAALIPGPVAAVSATVTVSAGSFRLSSTAVTVMSAVAVCALLSASVALPGFTGSV